MKTYAFFMKELQEAFADSLGYIDQLKRVKKDGMAIEFMPTVTREMEKFAIINNGLAIQFIRKPQEDFQLIAIRQNPLAIRHIKKPTEIVQIEVINAQPNYIKFIKNPSKKVKDLAKNKKGVNNLDHIFMKSFSRNRNMGRVSSF